MHSMINFNNATLMASNDTNNVFCTHMREIVGVMPRSQIGWPKSLHEWHTAGSIVCPSNLCADTANWRAIQFISNGIINSSTVYWYLWVVKFILVYILTNADYLSGSHVVLCVTLSATKPKTCVKFDTVVLGFYVTARQYDTAIT